MVLVVRHARRRASLLASIRDYRGDRTSIQAIRRRAINVITVADLLMEPRCLTCVCHQRRRPVVVLDSVASRRQQ